MALAIGKLTILAGAGLVGTILAGDGGVSTVSKMFSGAFKTVFKQLKNDDTSAPTSKGRYDSLVDQVNSLRKDLELINFSPVTTIVTRHQSGYGKYGVIVVVAVFGSGFFWWKGWKLSDMMFVTKGSLNNACSSVAKNLEDVYSSVSATKKQLSKKIADVDGKIDECADNTCAVKDEVFELRGNVKQVGADFQTVHNVVRSLETKISRIEVKQGHLKTGVSYLVGSISNILENSESMESVEGIAPLLSIEMSSTSTIDGENTPLRPSHSTVSVSKIKELEDESEEETNDNSSSSIIKTISRLNFFSRGSK